VHADDDEEMEWNWDAGVPHYQHPRYNDNDEVLFFPRIVGGQVAFHGEVNWESNPPRLFHRSLFRRISGKSFAANTSR
jgi:hypothetical protein